MTERASIDRARRRPRQLAPGLAPRFTLRLAFWPTLWLAGGLALAAGCGGTGLGKETRADITARMTSAQQPLESCYKAALQNNRKLKGTMVLAFVAEPKTGQFQEITVTRDELNDPAVRKCVIDEVGKLKLDKPQGSRVSISYPIRFAPNQ